jgi:putative membrane protein
MFYIYGGGGAHWLAWVVWLLVLVAIITTVLLVARSSRRHASHPHQWSGGQWQGYGHAGWQSPGLHELDLRYARGEITRDEYLQRRADMLSLPVPPPGGPPPGTPGPTSTA